MILLTRDFSKVLISAMKYMDTEKLITFKAEYSADGTMYPMRYVGGEFDVDNGVLRLKFSVDTYVPETSLVLISVIMGDDTYTIAEGVLGFAIEIGKDFMPVFQIANVGSTSSEVEQVIVNKPITINSTEYVLVATMDLKSYDYILIKGVGITMKLWDYDDPSIVYFEPNFGSTANTIRIPITSKMRGPVEIHAKGSGSVMSVILGKGNFEG